MDTLKYQQSFGWGTSMTLINLTLHRKVAGLASVPTSVGRFPNIKSFLYQIASEMDDSVSHPLVVQCFYFWQLYVAVPQAPLEHLREISLKFLLLNILLVAVSFFHMNNKARSFLLLPRSLGLHKDMVMLWPYPSLLLISCLHMPPTFPL